MQSDFTVCTYIIVFISRPLKRQLTLFTSKNCSNVACVNKKIASSKNDRHEDCSVNKTMGEGPERSSQCCTITIDLPEDKEK